MFVCVNIYVWTVMCVYVCVYSSEIVVIIINYHTMAYLGLR